MLGSFSNWLTWTTTNPKDEWDTWELWQRAQPPMHFEKSDIFQYYLTCRPQFRPPESFINNNAGNTYYVYCFGDFTNLMSNPVSGNIQNNSLNDVANYLLLLLDFYDTCKGISRRLTGDPAGISVLREVIKKNSLIPLHAHDFNQYTYDYSIIHAHTVAQYSLSTLLMRIVGNYMHQMASHGNYPGVILSKCERAYKEYRFGERNNSLLTSTPINIPAKVIIEEGRGSSWPRDTATCSRCSACNRVSENLWGMFNVCLDCHMKRICSKCSKPATIIGADNFPKCDVHQKEY